MQRVIKPYERTLKDGEKQEGTEKSREILDDKEKKNGKQKTSTSKERKARYSPNNLWR